MEFFKDSGPDPVQTPTCTCCEQYMSQANSTMCTRCKQDGHGHSKVACSARAHDERMRQQGRDERAAEILELEYWLDEKDEENSGLTRVLRKEQNEMAAAVVHVEDLLRQRTQLRTDLEKLQIKYQASLDHLADWDDLVGRLQKENTTLREELAMEVNRAPGIAAHAHGMGQENALQDILQWLESRAEAYGGEAAKLAAKVRSGEWMEELLGVVNNPVDNLPRPCVREGFEDIFNREYTQKTCEVCQISTEDCDCAQTQACGICVKSYDNCDCAETGRR